MGLATTGQTSVLRADAIDQASVSMATHLDFHSWTLWKVRLFVHHSFGSCMQTLACTCIHTTDASLLFLLSLLLPAIDDLAHVVLGGESAARLLCSSSLFAFLPLLLPPFTVLRRQHQVLLAAGGPQADAQALVALLHVALEALLPPLLLPGELVALLEKVSGVVVELHVQLVQLLDTLDLSKVWQKTR